GRPRRGNRRAPVGGRGPPRLRCDHGPGSDAVVHDHGLLELVLQLLRQHAREYVAAAARRKRTDEGDGARRKVLRYSRAGEQSQHEAEQKSSHILPRAPDCSRLSPAGVMLVWTPKFANEVAAEWCELRNRDTSAAGRV